jgi:hypothetical protein
MCQMPPTVPRQFSPAEPEDARADATDGDTRPLLLVDIDGVISLFGFAAHERPAGTFHWIDGIPHYLSSIAAQNLLELGEHFRLVWCSGWEEKADEYLPHLLGLPAGLEHLRFERSVGRANAHWKLDAIDAFCGSRPLAWIDDAFNADCHRWAQERTPPTLLVETEPEHGLTATHTRTLVRWSLEL